MGVYVLGMIFVHKWWGDCWTFLMGLNCRCLPGTTFGSEDPQVGAS